MPPTEGDKILAAARIGAAEHKSYWVRAWRSADQTLALGSVVPLSFDRSEGTDLKGVYDPMGMHDPVGDPTKVWIRNVRGIYRIHAFMRGASGGSALNPGPALIRLNGTIYLRPLVNTSGAADADWTLDNFLVGLNPGDYLELVGDNSSNGGTATSTSISAYAPILQVELVEAVSG